MESILLARLDAGRQRVAAAKHRAGTDGSEPPALLKQ
jgi:hypothetical protein